MNPDFNDSFILETSKRLENHETRIATMEHIITQIEEMYLIQECTPMSFLPLC